MFDWTSAIRQEITAKLPQEGTRLVLFVIAAKSSISILKITHINDEKLIIKHIHETIFNASQASKFKRVAN